MSSATPIRWRRELSQEHIRRRRWQERQGLRRPQRRDD